jgi:hypothetical protein
MLGKPVTEELIAAGFEVHICAREFKKAETLFGSKAKYVLCDLKDKNAVNNAPKGMDAVYCNLSVKSDRKRGSGSLIHNLSLAMRKMQSMDMKPYGWELKYDAWIKKQLDARNIADIINYENSHKLGKLAAPTPDHFVPVLYSLGLMDSKDELKYFYEDSISLPAFSERSFIISS